MPEGQRVSADALMPTIIQTQIKLSAIKISFYSLKREWRKLDFLQKHSLTSSAFLQNIFELKSADFKNILS